jgi:hypothetical protein
LGVAPVFGTLGAAPQMQRAVIKALDRPYRLGARQALQGWLLP